ncbi:MAG: ATP-binding protein, partial [Chloroflexota bacterium]
YDESLRAVDIMSALADSAAAINASLNLDEVLTSILAQTSKALEIEAASLALIESDTNELVFRAATGKGAKEVIGQRVKLGQGIAGWVAQQGSSTIVPKAEEDPRFFTSIDDRTGFQTRAIACAPIRSKGEVIGVIEALNPSNPFGEEIIKVLEGIGNIAGAAIDHARLFERVELEHQRYLELFEASIDPIIITNTEGNIIEANREALLFTKFQPEEINNTNIHHFHQVSWNTVWQNFENLTDENPLSYESTLHTKGDQEIQIEVHIQSINIDGMRRYQWILRDITEKKQLDELREDFASMIYHDLRSPLANVTSGLDVLSSILPDDDPTVRTVLDIAMRSTERVHRLASALLDTNRLESGQRIGNPEPTSAGEMLLNSVDIVRPMANHKDQKISTKIPARLPQVRVDIDMIMRVIINLLENAVKYTPNEGEISANLKQKGNWVHVIIEDNGMGIPTDEHGLVFEKFHRVRGTSSGGATGLGIGLAFCRLAVEGHGGQIWLESNNDKGSRFTFTLPVA